MKQFRPSGAGTTPKKSEMAALVVSASDGDAWRLRLIATTSGQPRRRANVFAWAAELGAAGGTVDFWLRNRAISH